LNKGRGSNIKYAFFTSTELGVAELQFELKELKAYPDDVFTDYNDINEDTRIQIELIHKTLAGLQEDISI